MNNEVLASGMIGRGKVIAVLILFATTILTCNNVIQYGVSGDELLVNNNFDNMFENWHRLGDAKVLMNDGQSIVRLRSEDNQRTVAIRQTLENIKKYQKVRFVATMKTDDVDHGDKAWKAARIIFVAKDNNGASMYNVPHVLVKRNGTTGWETFSKVFELTPGAASYYVEIQLVNTTGTMWVKGLSLNPVNETLTFIIFRIVDAFLWVGCALWILMPYRRSMFSSKEDVLVAIMVMLALFGTLMPPDLKYSAAESMKSLWPWVGGEEGLFRVGHFLVFCILSVTVFWKSSAGRIVLSRLELLILLAMSTEILQYLVPGRTPRISDLFIDISGVILGLFISRLILFRDGARSMREAE